MICFRCDRTIQGTPQIFSPEVGSGVAAEITLCPGSCRSTQTQRVPDEPALPIRAKTPAPGRLADGAGSGPCGASAPSGGGGAAPHQKEDER
ncbi:hypothetical protein ACFWNK_02880 [Streptomyces sp. NPDC058417]|uniref:hypothetical protein n=1 Tax=unclassified Streptomyces TaxID=2593676 RepID=UPI0036647711